MKDLIKYKELALKRADTEKAKGTTDLNKMICDYHKRSKWTHLEQIKLRLDLLKYIRTNSHLSLNMKQVFVFLCILQFLILHTHTKHITLNTHTVYYFLIFQFV
jgi:hypothetical protein